MLTWAARVVCVCSLRTIITDISGGDTRNVQRRHRDITDIPTRSPSHRVLTVARSTAYPQTACAPLMRINPFPWPLLLVAAASVRCLCSPSGCSHCSGCGFSTKRCYRLDSAGEHSGRRSGKAGVGVGVGCVRCGYKRRANPSMTFATWRESRYDEMAKGEQGSTNTDRQEL